MNALGQASKILTIIPLFITILFAPAFSAETKTTPGEKIKIETGSSSDDTRSWTQKLLGYKKNGSNEINPYPVLVLGMGPGILWWNNDPLGNGDKVSVSSMNISGSWIDPHRFGFIPAKLHYSLDAGFSTTINKHKCYNWNPDNPSYDFTSSTEISSISGGFSIIYDLTPALYGRAGGGCGQWKRNSVIKASKYVVNQPAEVTKYPQIEKFIMGYFDFHMGYRYFITENFFAGMELGSVITVKFSYPAFEAAVTCGAAF